MHMAHDSTQPEIRTMPTAVATTLLKVIEEIGKVGVAKEGQNAHHNFNYQHWDDVVPAVQQACVKHGMLILQEMTDVEEVFAVTGFLSNGAEKKQPRIRVKLWFKFIDVKTGQYLFVPYWGEALNTDDKGINKAVTSATKYVYIKVLQIAVKGVASDNDGSNAGEGTSEGQAPAAAPAAAAAGKPTGVFAFGHELERKVTAKQWAEDPTEKQWKAIYGAAANEARNWDKAFVPWVVAACMEEMKQEVVYVQKEDGDAKFMAPKATKGGVMVALAVTKGNGEPMQKMVEAAAALKNDKEEYDPFAGE
jgi:hypothetical protein